MNAADQALAKINASTKATKVALTQLAAKASPSTKVAAKAALKAAGMRQTLADCLLAEVARLAKLRAGKQAARRALPAPMGHGRKVVRLPAGTPQSRLDATRVSTISSTLHRTVRIGVNDETRINLTNDPAKIGLHQSELTSWDTYKGAYKGWACNFKIWKLTVPARWIVRVQRHGLAIVDDMMTLDAAPIESAGCELFAATWLVQRRGNACESVHGYIARHGTITYHGATADQALSGIARKVRELAFSARLDATDLGELVSKCADAVVSVADARKIGACEYGIKSWCASVGLDYESGAAKLADVYAAYQREPRTEARATILQVLRKNRAVIATI